MATREAERTASLRRRVETLAQMGMVLRLAGKPQEAERRFREALEIIHRPWPGYKEQKYLLGRRSRDYRANRRLFWRAS